MLWAAGVICAPTFSSHLTAHRGRRRTPRARVTRPPGYHETMSVACGGHQRIDQRSLALHRAIADKLRADPSLVEVARENLDRWSRQNGRSQPYWDAWRALLNSPLEDLLARMVEESEAMTAIDRSSA